MNLPEPFRLHSFKRVGSTNDEARRLAERGAGHGCVVQAEEQVAGRGRRGRDWFSPPGNLYCSILLDPGPRMARAPDLAFVSAVALRETFAALAPGRAWTCKWPNDVLCDGAKISGILLESAPPLIILGVGVNLVAAPPAALYATTTLADAGSAIAPLTFLAAFCRRLDAWYRRWQDEGFAPVRLAWLAHAVGVGARLTVRLADSASLEGIFAGLDDNGALLLDTPGGERRPVMAGDVFFAR